MAEGGQNPDKDNPFSFKSFVTKKDKNVTADGKASTDDDIDIFDLPDVSKQRKRDKSKKILVVDEEEVTGTQGEQKKKKGKSENPFSFKKFLSGSGGKSNERSSPVQQPSSGLRANETNESHGGVPNIHLTSDLPDFVQDHYSGSIGTSPRGVELPDFTIGGITDNGPDIGDSNFPSTDYSNLNAGENCNRRHDFNEDTHSDFDENSDTEDSGAVQGSLVNSLPDFLSDAAVSSSKNSDNVKCSVPIVSSGIQQPEISVTHHEDFQRLQDENAQLKRQLKELRTKKLQDADRIAELQRQMVEQKKKEVEETTAMEYAMEQVEQNLSATTKRAVLAESTVTKLKQEVKTLQTEIKALRGENGMLSGDQHLNDVKERTSYVAEQLSSATKTAETSLRQLLSGVDNLKLLSQVLNSIDKISEDTSKTSPDNS